MSTIQPRLFDPEHPSLEYLTDLYAIDKPTDKIEVFRLELELGVLLLTLDHVPQNVVLNPEENDSFGESSLKTLRSLYWGSMFGVKHITEGGSSVFRGLGYHEEIVAHNGGTVTLRTLPSNQLLNNVLDATYSAAGVAGVNIEPTSTTDKSTRTDVEEFVEGALLQKIHIHDASMNQNSFSKPFFLHDVLIDAPGVPTLRPVIGTSVMPLLDILHRLSNDDPRRIKVLKAIAGFTDSLIANGRAGYPGTIKKSFEFAFNRVVEELTSEDDGIAVLSEAEAKRTAKLVVQRQSPRKTVRRSKDIAKALQETDSPIDTILHSAA